MQMKMNKLSHGKKANYFPLLLSKHLQCNHLNIILKARDAWPKLNRVRV